MFCNGGYMKRTLLLFLALLIPAPAIQALSIANLIALAGPTLYFLNDSKTRTGRAVRSAMLTTVLGKLAKSTAEGCVKTENLPSKVMLGGMSVLTGILACFAAEDFVYEISAQ